MLAGPHSSLTPEDRGRVADLHLKCQSEASINWFGKAFVRAFYAFVETSPQELLVVEWRNEVPAGACVMSISPGSMSRRMATQTPLLLFLPRALSRREFWAFLYGTMTRPRSESKPYGGVPEVVYVFTDPNMRGLGLGRHLIDVCEAWLAERGFREYVVKTWTDQTHPVRAFYQALGFRETGITTSLGRSLAVLRKTLPTAGCS